MRDKRSGNKRTGRSREARGLETGRSEPRRPGDETIAVTHYDTDAVPSHLRHAAWSARGWPSVAALFESQAIGEFATEADRVEFDGVTVQYAWGTAREFVRSADRVADDGIDILGVGAHFDDAFTGTARGRTFDAPPGALLFLDMAQASRVTVPEGRSLQLGLPRGIAQEYIGDVGALHGDVISSERSAMLINHLLNLRDALPGLNEHQKPRLSRTVLDMLAISLDSDTGSDRETSAPPSEPAVSARREIEARLGQPSLTVPALCAALRMSRSALYRLFEAEGGVEAYIRRRRLEQVYQALLDPANRERIGELADRWGFSDASHLSRQFREAYGETPGAVRARRFPKR